MKRLLVALISSSLALGALAANPRNVSLTFNAQSDRNLRVAHKTYTGLKITGTLKDGGSAVNLTGETGTIAFKTHLTNTAFFAQAAITLDDAANGIFSATLGESMWRTNLSNSITLWGDVRFANYANPLPSMIMKLRPSANQGDETGYTAPAVATFRTNEAAIASTLSITFSNFTYSASATNVNIVDPGGAINDEVYGASWNGDTATGASRNAIYDKIELVSGGGDSLSVTNGAVVDANIIDTPTVAFTLLDSGTGVQAAVVSASLTTTHLGTDSVNTDELNATGVESELEAVLDLADLQGQIGDAQIANDAVDSAEIEDGAVGAADLATDSVQGAELDSTDATLIEEIDDLVDALINDADSVHTRITITYDDVNNAIDFVVDDMNDDAPDDDSEVPDAITVNPINATTETAIEAVVDLDELQGQIGDAQIAAAAVDGGAAGEIADNTVDENDLAADSVQESELDEAMNFTPTGAWDFGGATSLEVPNGAVPTVDAFGEIAADNNAFAASKGAVIMYDGTISNFLVGVSATDTPTDGQVPKISMPSGVITWEDDDQAAPASGDSIEVEDGDNGGSFSTVDTTARLEDSADIDFERVDGGAGGPDEITGSIRTDAVSADELDATGVEAELEAVLDIDQLQGTLAHSALSALGADDHAAAYLQNTNSVIVWQSDGDKLEFAASADTDDARGVALELALGNAYTNNARDVIVVGAGVFGDIDDTTGSGVILSENDTLRGAGIFSTVLEFAGSQDLVVSNGFEICDLTIDHPFSEVVGQLRMASANVTGTISRVRFLNSGTAVDDNVSAAFDDIDLTFDQCIFSSDFDNIAVTADRVTIRVRDSLLNTDGSNSTDAHNYVISGARSQCVFEAVGCTFINTDAASASACVALNATDETNSVHISASRLITGGSARAIEIGSSLKSSSSFRVAPSTEWDPTSLTENTAGILQRAIIVDSPNQRVGFGTNAPAVTVEILGDLTTHGVIDFGSATSLEIPNAANPTTAAAGKIAHNSTDNQLEVNDLGLTLRYSEEIGINEPHEVQNVTDGVQLIHFATERFAHGVTILDLIVSTSATCTDDLNFEEWSNNGTSWSTDSTVEAITLSGTRTEDDGTLADSAIAADAYLFLDLDDTPTAISNLTVTVVYSVNDD